MKNDRPQNPAQTIPEGYVVIAHIALDSVHDVLVHLRQGGVRAQASRAAAYGVDPKPDYHAGRYRIRPHVPTNPLAVPQEEIRQAKQLLREWYRLQDARILPLKQRIYRDLLHVVLVWGVSCGVLWLLARDLQWAALAGIGVVCFWLFYLVSRNLLRKNQQAKPTWHSRRNKRKGRRR